MEQKPIEVDSYEDLMKLSPSEYCGKNIAIKSHQKRSEILNIIITDEGHKWDLSSPIPPTETTDKQP